jgi:V8-like Glu-specific endopeptidase
MSQTAPVDLPLLSSDEMPLWTEHPVHGHAVDIVALPIRVPDQFQLFPVSWRNPIPLAQRIGMPAKVVGYPFGMRINENWPAWATGHLASEPEVDVDGLPLMLIDCRTRRGHSGSPVLLHYPRGMMYVHEDQAASVSDADVSRLLGIYSGRISAGSDIGRVWKLSAIREIVETF